MPFGGGLLLSKSALAKPHQVQKSAQSLWQLLENLKRECNISSTFLQVREVLRAGGEGSPFNEVEVKGSIHKSKDVIVITFELNSR